VAEETAETSKDNKAAALEATLEAGVLDATSSVCLIDLPCGYLDHDGTLYTDAEVREISGVEEDMLGGRSSYVKKLGELLVQCTNRIGPYTDKKDLRRIVGELMQGDRVQLLLQIRIVTFGPMYSVYEMCPKCERTGPPYSIDLADLTVVKMPLPRSRMRELVLPRSKKKVQVQFMTGAMEEAMSVDHAKLAKANPKDPLLEGRTLGLAPRIKEINGKPAKMADVRALSMADRQFLYAYFDKEEGGVDTTGEYECGVLDDDGVVCGHQFSAPLRFGDGFFSQSSVTTSSS
jgi:hypothetical protein